MRAFFLSAVVVTALTLLTPAESKAQVFVNSSPYGYSAGYVYPGTYGYAAYSYPSYAYSYGYNYPGYRTYAYGWSNPYSTWNWAGYRAYPTYFGGYYGYGGWRRY